MSQVLGCQLLGSIRILITTRVVRLKADWNTWERGPGGAYSRLIKGSLSPTSLKTAWSTLKATFGQVCKCLRSIFRGGRTTGLYSSRQGLQGRWEIQPGQWWGWRAWSIDELCSVSLRVHSGTDQQYLNLSKGWGLEKMAPSILTLKLLISGGGKTSKFQFSLTPQQQQQKNVFPW